MNPWGQGGFCGLSNSFYVPVPPFWRVVYLLVGAAEGWGGWQGHAYSCALLGYAVLRYGVGVGVGVGVMRISGRRFIALLARRKSKDKFLP